MRWIDKLERRWGRYGIPNLMNIILVGQLIAWVIVMVINQNFYYAITLNRTSLMSGADLACCDLFVCSATVNGHSVAADAVFPLVGRQLIAARVGRFPLYDVHSGGHGGCIGRLPDHRSAGASGIFLSLFFAYAWMWPEQQVLLFFILPIKMKWMACGCGYVGAGVLDRQLCQQGQPGCSALPGSWRSLVVRCSPRPRMLL